MKSSARPGNRKLIAWLVAFVVAFGVLSPASGLSPISSLLAAKADTTQTGLLNPLPPVCYDPTQSYVPYNWYPIAPASVGGYAEGLMGAGVRWLSDYLVNLILQQKEKASNVQAARDSLAYCFPQDNVVIAQPTAGSTQHMTGVLLVRTVSFDGSTFRIYVFKSGTFYQAGDLGYDNWAYSGWWSKSSDGHTVTFSEPPAPTRDPSWTAGAQSCEIQGRALPDPNRYYATFDASNHDQTGQAVTMLLNDFRNCYPDYNVLIMANQQASHWAQEPGSFVYNGVYCLGDPTYDECTGPGTTTEGFYHVYVFKTGVFRNDGDGGYNNWAFYGNFTRSSDGMTVTFGDPVQADLSVSQVDESAPADFNSETPKYTSTANGPYPGCDYTGSVPGDRAALIESLVTEYQRCFPDWNILAVHTLDDFTFSGLVGFMHIATVDGVYVLGVKTGIVVNTGDGGWLNWGFSGTYDRPDANTTVFHDHSTSGGGTLPCDIYAASGTPCVATYSTVRALFSSYDGPLYQVERSSDGATAGIGLLAKGGYVNAGQQDSFCSGTTCTITEIYDQSPQGNNLTIEGAGGNAGADRGANAAALPVTIGGHKAYGVDIEQGTGYRDNSTRGIAVNGQPEGMYMVASGTHVNSGCCFDFGNVETSGTDTGSSDMDAVNLTTWCGSNSAPCTGGGPWVEADLENGQWMGSGPNPGEQGNSTPYVTAMLKNDGKATFALKGGDSSSGGLTTWYNGALPAVDTPMHQEGAIVLGTGGDNSNSDVGSFFEGVMTAGYPSDAADNAVQASIVAAGYAGSTNPAGGGAGNGVTSSAAGPAVVHSAGAAGAGAAGFSSVYTVDAASGHLQESYLPYMGDSWATQDLSANYHTPAVMPGTKPVAIVHCGYTSVYTVDASSGDLQETYLPAIGGPWYTQDLSANYGTPPTSVTPTAVVHAAGAAGAAAICGYTSVYTVDQNGDLRETYLPIIGGPWYTQDLSANYHAPRVQAGTSPVAIVHCGYTSVYTVDEGGGHLQETYLPAIGGPWSTQDLSANYNTPATDTTPTAVVHSAGAGAGPAGCDGYTSVYTVDRGGRDLQETYLPNQGFPGDPWHTQDLSANYHTPAVAPGTAPVALVHMGFTSVYTVDEGSDQLQETYLPAIGDSWNTQSLSANYGAPRTDQTPVVLLHPDASGNLDWASVFTTDEYTSHLQETYLPNTGFPGDSWNTQDLSANYNTPPAYQLQSSPASWSVAHDGYTSTYTVDASNGDLQETYLPAMGDSWSTQDLSANYHTPAVAARSEPVALVHDGYTSVYTVDKSNSDLQETYLPSLGDSWATQDLSANYHTPPVSHDTSPTAVFHDGYASVYTVDAGSGDLQETYLPAAGFPGDPWSTQDLSVNYHTPPVMPGTSPVAILHDGYTSVYTVDAGSGDLQETYLPYMGDSWSTQDLTANYGVPKTEVTPTAVFHDGYASVYTVDWNGDLQESYLPYLGDSWSTQDLTANYGVPQDINVAPAALYHDGYTSVYYLTGPSDHLVEAYLPAISGPWGWQDLSANYSTPPSVQSPSPLVHYDTSGGLTWASVYTTDASNGDVQETYLPDAGFPGDSWSTQDLSANYHAPAAAPPGSVMYSASSSTSGLGYARMTRLEHAGSEDGTLLATFEDSNNNGSVTSYHIQKSTDDGATWSTLSTVPADADAYAPFLYEFPKQLGNYPAGTLMLLGNTEAAGNTKATIYEWLSFDHGASWLPVGVVQSSSGGPGGGVWEPFVTLDSSGNLAMLFSDERQNATYSQFIGEVTSTDGGLTWSANPDGSTRFGPGEIKVIASPWQADRPGMATVTQLGAGAYAMSYEMCGPHNCSVYTKTSADGDNWGSGPSDFGSMAETAGGVYLQESPVITSANGTLYLAAHNEVNSNGPIPEDQTVVLANTSGGQGAWSWIPAPAIPTVGASAYCHINYSPDVLPTEDGGGLLYTAAAATGPNNCQEVTDAVPITP